MWHPRMNPATAQATAQMCGPCEEAGARADAASAPADTLAGLSVDVARRHLARAFRERNIDTPEVDARIIVGHALGLDHAALVAQSGRVLVPQEADAIAALAARRCAHEPVARILGCKEFWGLPLRVNAETLLPRPETETVVEAALAALEGRHRTSDPAAHRRPRHRLGRTAPGAAFGTAERWRDRHGYQRGRARLRARQCRRARPVWPCRIRGLRLRGRSRGTVRHCCFQSSLCRARGHCRPAAGGARLRSAARARWWSRRSRRVSRNRCSRSPPARAERGRGGGTRPGARDRRGLDFYRGGACAAGDPARSFGHRPGSRLAPSAMSPPHSCCEKKRLDCGPRPTRFRRGIDPRLLSADSEPRSRTAESRRCEPSGRRTPDDPAESSPNRDEMLHRFGADPRARRTCP